MIEVNATRFIVANKATNTFELNDQDGNGVDTWLPDAVETLTIVGFSALKVSSWAVGGSLIGRALNSSFFFL